MISDQIPASVIPREPEKSILLKVAKKKENEIPKLSLTTQLAHVPGPLGSGNALLLRFRSSYHKKIMGFKMQELQSTLM